MDSKVLQIRDHVAPRRPFPDLTLGSRDPWPAKGLFQIGRGILVEDDALH